MVLRSTLPSRLSCGVHFWMWNASLIFRFLFQRENFWPSCPANRFHVASTVHGPARQWLTWSFVPSLIASQCSFFHTRSARKVSPTYSPEHVLHFTEYTVLVIESFDQPWICQLQRVTSSWQNRLPYWFFQKGTFTITHIQTRTYVNANNVLHMWDKPVPVNITDSTATLHKYKQTNLHDHTKVCPKTYSDWK